MAIYCFAFFRLFVSKFSSFRVAGDVFSCFLVGRIAFFVISSFFVALFRLHASSFCVALFHGEKTKWHKPDTIDSSLYPSSAAVQPVLCRTCSETPKTGFVMTRLK